MTACMQFFPVRILIVLMVMLMTPAGGMADAAADTLEIMSGCEWDGETDVTGWWVSEKLDGVRGVWTGTRLMTRTGNVIRVPEWFIKNFPPFPLDGELWTGRGRFAEIAGMVQQTDAGDAWHRAGFYIFDVPHETLPFEKRLEMAVAWFKEHPSDTARLIEQTPCKSNAALWARLKRVEELGGEGLMIRRPESLYATGRSRDILKVKSYADTEAVVIGHIGGKGKYEGMLGALLVKLPDGIQFKIGTGFSDKDRKNPPPVGSTVTFRYRGLHPSGIPRFASFLRIRPAL